MTGFEALALTFAVASTAIETVAGIAEANANADAAAYEAQVEERNRQIADRNARMALDQAEVDKESARRQGRRQLGAIRAAYGASGFELAGSPLDVLEDSAAELALDQEKILYEGRLEALDQQDKGAAASARANLKRVEASSAKRSRTTILLGGATKIGSSFLKTYTPKRAA